MRLHLTMGARIERDFLIALLEVARHIRTPAERARRVLAALIHERKVEMPWYYYALEFVSGLLLTNGVPHFVQGVSGHRFQSPFASPHGVSESSRLTNTHWRFADVALGFILL